eukprot:gene3987-4239_t
MIIWDMQNTRIPTELEPTDVIRFLYNTFVMQPGPRRCAGAFCTFTDNTKKAVGERRFNQFCSNGVLNFMMINSPGGPRKADDSDHPLKEMMMNFTVDCVRGHKDGVVVLITADADFVRPALWCKQQGCVSFELLYYDPIASKEIRGLEVAWKMEWRDFLDCSVGRSSAAVESSAEATASDADNVDAGSGDGEVDVDAAVAAAIAAAALAARPDDFLSELQTPAVEPLQSPSDLLQNPETYLHGFPPCIATSQGLGRDDGGFAQPLMCNNRDSGFGSCSCSSSESSPIALEDLNLSGERVLPSVPRHLMMPVSPPAAAAVSAPKILDQLDFSEIQAHHMAAGRALAGLDGSSSPAAAAQYDLPSTAAMQAALGTEPVPAD